MRDLEIVKLPVIYEEPTVDIDQNVADGIDDSEIVNP